MTDSQKQSQPDRASASAQSSSVSSGPSGRQKLVWKLTLTVLVISIAIGTVLGCVQLLLDFRQHSTALDERFQRIAATAMPPASRALQTLDSELAEEVVQGLTLDETVSSAYVIDEYGQVLAFDSAEPRESETAALTRLIAGESRSIGTPLTAATIGGKSVNGELKLNFDIDRALQPFYERAAAQLLGGLVKGMILCAVLILALRRLLTTPLNKLTRTILHTRPGATASRLVTVPNRHIDDEIGLLAKSFNSFADRTSELMKLQSESQQHIRNSASQLKLIIDTVPHMVFARDRDDAIVLCNRAFAEFYGSGIDSLTGRRHAELQSKFSDSEAEQLTLRYQRYAQKVGEAKDQNRRLPRQYDRLMLSNAVGDSRWVELTQLPIDSLGEDCTLVIAQDVTDAVRTQDTIDQLAFEDGLTGLPNRRLTLDRLGFDITRSRNSDVFGGFLILDLDSFKTINDSFGHSAGDELLVQVARHLRQILHDEITIGRIGGDEFAILAPDLGTSYIEAATGAEFIAQTVLRELKRAFVIQAGEFHIDSSIGIAIYPEAESSAESVLRSADTALFQAKQHGGSVHRLFTESMKDAVRSQLDLEVDLRRALKEHEFCLHFQPLVRVSDNSIIGAECLVRWQHPTKGLIYPDVFISALEQHGFMTTAGDSIMDMAFAQLSEWQLAGVWPSCARLSINISPSQFFEANFVDKIIQRLSIHKVAPACIELEITESTVMQDIRGTMNKIETLKSLGIRFALDDFGTGYSSLSYLKLLPVDVLKIDRSFVKDAVDPESSDVAILKTIIAMARHLKLLVVAEGVETESHLQLLREHHCDNYQGYLYSRPVAADAFAELLGNRHAAVKLQQ